MTDRLPDMTDPDVRDMILRDHQPEEMWSIGGLLISVHCAACFTDWPCPSIKAAREAEHTWIETTAEADLPERAWMCNRHPGEELRQPQWLPPPRP